MLEAEEDVLGLHAAARRILCQEDSSEFRCREVLGHNIRKCFVPERTES
jgi:hypothetical protein